MCLSTFAKFFLMLINIAFFLGGLVLVILGIIARFANGILQMALSKIPNIDEVSAGWDLHALIKDAAIAIIIIGVILFVVGFCGFCGATNGSSCLLGIYALLVVVVIIVEILVAIIIYSGVGMEQIKDALAENLQQTYSDSTDGLQYEVDGQLVFATSTAKLGWDSVQVMMGCCGVKNDMDYNGTFAGTYMINFHNMVGQVPLSCCTSVNKTEYEERESIGLTERQDIMELEEATWRCLIAPDDTLVFTSANSSGVDSVDNSSITGTTAGPQLASYRNQNGCFDEVLMAIKDAMGPLLVGILIGILFVEIAGLASAVMLLRDQYSVKQVSVLT